MNVQAAMEVRMCHHMPGERCWAKGFSLTKRKGSATTTALTQQMMTPPSAIDARHSQNTEMQATNQAFTDTMLKMDRLSESRPCIETISDRA